MSASCRDCRFWEKLEYGWQGANPDAVPERPVDATEDTPLRAEKGKPWGVCSREGESGTLMVTCDASLYASNLYTRVDFGCVQFEG